MPSSGVLLTLIIVSVVVLIGIVAYYFLGNYEGGRSQPKNRTLDNDAHDPSTQGGGKRLKKIESEIGIVRVQQAEIVKRLKELESQISKGFTELRVAVSSTNSTRDAQPPAGREVHEPGREPEPTMGRSIRFGPRKPESELLAEQYNQNATSLRNRYRVREFTIANMQAMGKDHTLMPAYRFVEPNEQGEYWLVDSDGGKGYAVPRPKQTYNIGQFKSGGLDRIFECRGVRQGYRYRRVEVIKPAIFRDSGSGNVELVESGTLEFHDEEAEL